MSTHGFTKPLGVCGFGNNLLVADKEDKRILIIDDNGNHVRSIHLQDYQPKRICSTPEGTILVTKFQRKTLVLDQRGNITKELGSIRGCDLKYEERVGICINSRNEILITDIDKHRVLIFSQEGQFLRTFGTGRGDCPNHFDRPRGICVDWQDNVYIADGSNDRISIFTREGIPIQQVYIFRPIDVCLMGRRILVTSQDNLVQIFSN